MHGLIFVVLSALVVIGCAMHSHFLREMRSRHPRVWESLGRPTLVMNNSISNGLAFLRFLWRRDYDALDDPEFARLGRQLRTFTFAYLILLAAVLGWSFIEIFRSATRAI
jgi:hypothetical protein